MGVSYYFLFQFLDPDEHCKNGSELLDRLLKVIYIHRHFPGPIISQNISICIKKNQIQFVHIGHRDWITTNIWFECNHSIITWTNLHAKFVFAAIYYIVDISVECSTRNKYDYIFTGNIGWPLSNAWWQQRGNTNNVIFNIHSIDLSMRMATSIDLQFLQMWYTFIGISKSN